MMPVIAGMAPGATRILFDSRVLHFHPPFSERSGSTKGELAPGEGLTTLVPFFFLPSIMKARLFDKKK